MKTVNHPLSGRQRGIALVITLIMLAVTLVMALAFLAISTRERGSVSTSTDAAHAREATEAALAQAEAQILVNLLANTNSYNFGLLVSTNYLNTNGFLTTSGPGTGISSTTNVDYTYADGTPLTSADMQVNVANLQYLPRPPVFVPTNGVNGGYDFRYYLDLNRNRQFDANNGVSNWVYLSSQNIFTNTGPISEIGDPEWIGVLEHPDQPHGPQNKFIARYAFIAVPVGNTLDVNAMYNDVRMPDAGSGLNMKPGNDGFQRDEDVGNWELNLAAFLADLNTNQWDAGNSGGIYNYESPLGFQNTGGAFDDALSILRYRYDYNINNLPTMQLDYGANDQALQNNGLDNSSIGGPLMTNAYLPFHSDKTTLPWAGSVNTNAFFSLSDFFNESIFRPAAYNIPPGTPVFPDRLTLAGITNPIAGNSTVPTYDRYTFYHLLEELGTDSTPDYGKLNLNYVNVDASGNVVPGMETNFIAWNASQFFTNAADRLLRTYTSNWFNVNFVDQNNNLFLHYYFTNTFGNYTLTSGAITNTLPFGVTNIPVWVGGRFVYTSAVQRLLQLAANMYDATTTNFYPSVFRPTFGRDATTGNIYISGYQQVANISGGINDFRLSQPVDISLLVTGGPYPPGNGGAAQNLNNINVYGVPWIIGAKKGLPSFNQMTVLNAAQVSRLVQVNRFATNNYQAANFTTNVMFLMSISNSVGMSLWNSYNADYVGSGINPANISILMQDTMRVNLTNALNSGSILTNFTYYMPNLSAWPGSAWTSSNATNLIASQYSFYFTNWTFPFLAASVYQPSTGLFIPLSDPAAHFNTNDTINHPFPQFGMMTTNWAQAFIIDGTNVLDYVQFSGPNRTRNLTTELSDPNYPDGTGIHYMWSTNAYPAANALGEPPYGEINQISLSRGSAGVTAPPGGTWAVTPTAPGAGTSPAAQQAFFGGFFTPSWIFNGIKYANTQYSVQAPYTPTRTMYDYSLWEANDPLVHYLASDLYYAGTNANGLQRTDTYPPTYNIVGLALNQVGGRFQPWGLNQQLAGFSNIADTNNFNYAYRDPLVVGPDAWQFPTNLFPDVGWLGRVHRGTPWQTVYLKSPDILRQTNTYNNSNNGTNTWLIWTGNLGNWFDAENASPVTDRLLFDLFTTEPNENATLGQLSINQPHIAAWSAVLSGMVVLTNLTDTNLTVFPPGGAAGTNSYLGYIWSSIQQTRTDTNLFPKQVFGHVGDVLASPGLTINSPFLTWTDPNVRHFGISDAMYEWLPQHIMSHLKVGAPRYVIYCYGQSLKPAQNGLVTSGPNALMCTNYQITSESAVRAVISVESPNSFTPHVILKNLNPLPPDQ